MNFSPAWTGVDAALLKDLRAYFVGRVETERGA